MVNSLSFATALVSLAVLGAAQKCPLVFDSRVPTAMTAATLDTDQSPFNPAFVKGKGKCTARESRLTDKSEENKPY